jgi:hypothetical protein
MKTQTPRSSFIARQSGIATVAIAFLLLLIMGLSVLGASTLTSGVARDSGSDHQRLQALFMAETALERATYRFNNGVACASLTETNLAMTSTGGAALGTVTLTPFTTQFDGTTNVGASCRVRATATTATGQVVRSIEAFVNQTSFTSSRGNRKFQCTVNSGSNLALVISVAWTTSNTVNYTITGVSFGGIGMTSAAAVTTTTDSSSRYSVQNFYLLSPTTGTVSGAISMTGDPSSIIIGCTVLTGANSSTPLDATGTATGNSNAPSVTVHTGATSGNRFVIDNLARDNGGSLSMTAASGRVEGWNFTASGKGGAGSSRGVITLTGTDIVMGWTWNQTKTWALAGVSMFGNTATQTGAVISSVSSGNGVAGWREITVPPS